MSYLAVELDAINVAPAVARAAGVSENDVLGGLLRLWAWCFREETDMVTSLQLRGHFGVDLGQALAAFGFVESVDGVGWRVRGAERYLRIRAAQREGGRKGRAKSSSPVGGASGGGPEVHRKVDLEVDLGSTSKSAQALTPNTEHRAPNTEHRTPNDVRSAVDERVRPATLQAIEAPTSEPEGWSGHDFWCWYQSERRKGGEVQERPPHPAKLSAWWSIARGTASVARLQAAAYRYGEDPYWVKQNPSIPFAGFMSQWDRWVRSEVTHAVG